MTAEQMKIHKKLWDIANDLRGSMNPDEFKNYILGFIFFKFLSEKIEITLNQQLKNEKMTFAQAYKKQKYKKPLEKESKKRLGYFIDPKYLFFHFVERARKKEFFLDDLDTALKKIEDSTQGYASEEDFLGLFDDVDLTSTRLGKTENAKNKKIGDIFLNLAEIDFDLKSSNIDVLGDAYEYLISQFASSAGKKAGEFYTPQEVSTILARIVTIGKDRIKKAYDPTCGSGSLLMRIGRETKVGTFYGQELNQTTYNLARMNMILHGIKFSDFSIEQGNTLTDPAHKGMTFEAVVANPPFSAKWSASDTFLSDERFSNYGKLAPKSKADFAFVQHMLYHLDENGTMCVVLPHGVLFRGSSEEVIRKYLIKEKNWLDAVIGLPPNVFFGTGIPTAVLVFKKCRESDKNILFIDASKGFEKAGNKNKLRQKDIDKIVDTYKKRRSYKKFSHVAKLKEIQENEYNLNIPRYVDTFDEEEPVDIKGVVKEIKDIDRDMKKIDTRIKKGCKELGVESPV